MTAQLDMLVRPAALACGWCGLDDATVIVLSTPTCDHCAASRVRRVAAYQDRLERSAKEKP